MAGGVVTVGRRQYACGLYWENSPSGRVTQTAKEAARQPSMQAAYYAVRAGTKAGRVPQFCLSQEMEAHRAGIPVLAACLANQQPGSWAGGFRLREGSAVIVIRDDLVVPDGDLFFTDETEARDRLLQEMAIGGLQKVYAPETWGIAGTDSMPVSLLLNEDVSVKLKSVAMSRSTILALGAVGGLVLLLLGGGWYLQEREANEERLKQEREKALERLKFEVQNKIPGMETQPVYPPPERKWEKHPRPLEVVSACNDLLKQVNYAVAGWKLDGIRCDEGGLSENWSRIGGFSAPPPGAKVSDTGASATLSIPMPAQLLKARGDEALIDPEEVTRRYLAQNWPGGIGRMPDDPPPPPPPGHQGPWNPPPAPWVKRSFTLSMPVLPWTLPDYFANMPGIVIDALSTGGTDLRGSWSIQGVIYENRH